MSASKSSLRSKRCLKSLKRLLTPLKGQKLKKRDFQKYSHFVALWGTEPITPGSSNIKFRRPAMLNFQPAKVSCHYLKPFGRYSLWGETKTCFFDGFFWWYDKMAFFSTIFSRFFLRHAQTVWDNFTRPFAQPKSRYYWGPWKKKSQIGRSTTSLRAVKNRRSAIFPPSNPHLAPFF